MKFWPEPTTTQKQRKAFESAKDDVRTALTVCKEGVELGKVMGIIRDSIGCDIDFRAMGFHNFGQFLYHIDDILEVRVLPYESRKFLFLKESALTDNARHMRRMVQEQANAKTNKRYARPTMKNTRQVPSEALIAGYRRPTQAGQPLSPSVPRPLYSGGSRPAYIRSNLFPPPKPGQPLSPLVPRPLYSGGGSRPAYIRSNFFPPSKPSSVPAKPTPLSDNARHMRWMVQEQSSARTNTKHAWPAMNTSQVPSEALIAGCTTQAGQSLSASAPKPLYSGEPRPACIMSKPVSPPPQPSSVPAKPAPKPQSLSKCPCPSSPDPLSGTEMDDHLDWLSQYYEIWDKDTEYPEGEGVTLDWAKNDWHNPAESIPYVDVPLMKMVVFRLSEYLPSNRFMLTFAKSESETFAFTSTINGYYNTFGSRMADISLSHLKSKGIYAGYDDDLHNWFRVQVDLREGVKADIVKVSSIDYGTTMKIKRSNLRYLAKKFACYPRQAFQADLWIGDNLKANSRAEIDKRLGRRVGALHKVYVAAQLPDYVNGIEFLRTSMVSLLCRKSLQQPGPVS